MRDESGSLASSFVDLKQLLVADVGRSTVVCVEGVRAGDSAHSSVC